jgi:very-short-patch-repair endonuclease
MKISKRGSMKIERVVADLLIKNKIPFEFRKIINGRETDFIIADKIILEVDGIIHKDPKVKKKDGEKSKLLSDLGYRIFLRFSAKEIRQNKQKLINIIKNLC